MKALFRRSNSTALANANDDDGGGGGGQQRDASNTTTVELELEEEWDGSTIHSCDNINIINNNNGIGTSTTAIVNNHSIINDENEGNYRCNHQHHDIMLSNSFNNDGQAQHHHPSGNKFQLPRNISSSSSSLLRKRTKRIHSAVAAASRSSSSLLSTTSNNNNSNNNNSTITTSSYSKKISSLFDSKQQQLQLPKTIMNRRNSKREMVIAEARHRASLRLQPPPFASESLVRLHELKEAKHRLSLSSAQQLLLQNQYQQRECISGGSSSGNDVVEEEEGGGDRCSGSTSGGGGTTTIAALVADDDSNCSRHDQNNNNSSSSLVSAALSFNSIPSDKSIISKSKSWKEAQVVGGGYLGGNSTKGMTSLAGRHGLIFLGATLLHVAIIVLSLPHYDIMRSMSPVQQQQQQQQQQQYTSFLSTPILIIIKSISLVVLQAIALRYLLSSSIVYSFDNIDFGQLLMVRNMNYVKKMFVSKVQSYSSGVAIGVVGISIGISLLLSVGSTRLERPEERGGETSLVDPWYIRAYDISIILTTRLGVFVLAALLLGHMFLPPHKVTTDGGNESLRTLMKVVEEREEGEGVEQQQQQLGKKWTHGSRHLQRERLRSAGSVRGKNVAGGALSWSVTFIMFAAVTAAVAGASSSSYPASSPTTLHFPNEKKAVQSSILVAGSVNADTFLPVHRFPSPGENLTLIRNQHPMVDVPGGKGCNQAVACAKLLPAQHHGERKTRVSFLGQFGNDSASTVLRDALVNNDVDVSPSGQSRLHPSGRGYVLIVPDTGEVSAVVSGGSNVYGWEHWGVSATDCDEPCTLVDDNKSPILSDQEIGAVISPYSLLLLQCEVPNLVNLRLACAARKLGLLVLLDVGGEDRTMERDLLECCDYLIPNETELERLAKSFQDDLDEDLEGVSLSGMTRQEIESIQAQIGSKLNLSTVLKSIRTLQRNGANNVLVTLGSQGSILIKKDNQISRPQLLYMPACKLPAESTVVDETGAGDCYRAGFAVALLEHCMGNSMIRDEEEKEDLADEVLKQCMRFASAAGALAVTKKGAVPSIPSRMEVDELLASQTLKNTDEVDGHSSFERVPRGGGHNNDDEDDFPFLFGSRINSMKDRVDLLDPSLLPISTPRDYLRRMANVRGIGCVDFNFPQHFDGYWTPEEAKKALDDVNLLAGAVCLRYPSKFARGAMNHPDAEMRREAIEITKKAGEAARILGCNEVVVWSAYDGYDYPFQVSYQEKWDQIVHAFRECCDAYPDIKWSLEFKPTDENTRFFTVPSTGAAILLVNEIDRPNMGLTLDMGHMLMAGENPGQSIALVGEKLYGIQLNDGYTRLAAEDGLVFGSIHPSIALETMHQLRRINFRGHLYFDTFPQRTDPVKEAEFNIRRVKEFWFAVTKMDAQEVERIAREHDAIGALELVSEALKR